MERWARRQEAIDEIAQGLARRRTQRVGCAIDVRQDAFGEDRARVADRRTGSGNRARSDPAHIQQWQARNASLIEADPCVTEKHRMNVGADKAVGLSAKQGSVGAGNGDGACIRRLKHRGCIQADHLALAGLVMDRVALAAHAVRGH